MGRDLQDQERLIKKTLSLALVTAMACLAAVITAAPAARASVPSYASCLNPS